MPAVWVRNASLAALFLAAGAGHAASHKPFYLSLGAQYLTGRYGGSESQDDVYVPLSLGYQGSGAGASITIPYLRFSYPSVEGDVTEYATRSGAGDVTTWLTLYDMAGGGAADWGMDATAGIKFATADEAEGLGTGENDYSAQLDFYRFYSRTVLLGTVGYKRQGDPAFVQLDDVWFGAVGGTYRVSANNRFAVFYDYRSPSLEGNDPLRELTLYHTHRINSDYSTSVYLIAGFGDGSPDHGAGMSITVRF